MNIAVFIKRTHMHKAYGGMETFNKELCNGLVALGHSVTVFAPAWELDTRTKTENGVTYRFIPCKYKMGLVLGFFGSYDKENWFNLSYDEFLKQHRLSKFDIVLSQSSAGVGIIQRKNKLDVKVISIAHGTIISEYKTFFKDMRFPKDIIVFCKNTGFVLKNLLTRQREYIRHADRVIAVADFVKRELVKETRIPSNRVTVIHNGIDSDKYAKHLVKNDGAVRLVYTGRIHRSKGLFLMIDVVRNTHDIEFHVYGLGEDFEELAKAINRAGLNNRYILHGQIKHEDMAYTLAQYDIFVLPSLRVEGFPMTLVEAMFASLPTIASNIGGINEAVQDGKTGLLVTSGNYTDLENAILTLSHDTAKRIQFGNTAYEYAMQNFNISKMLESYEKVIKEVLIVPNK